jgi:hypothetical protein
MADDSPHIGGEERGGMTYSGMSMKSDAGKGNRDEKEKKNSKQN